MDFLWMCEAEEPRSGDRGHGEGDSAPVAADASRWIFSGCTKQESHGLATAATGEGNEYIL